MKLRSTLLLLAAPAVAGAIGLSASQAGASQAESEIPPFCVQFSTSMDQTIWLNCPGYHSDILIGYGKGSTSASSSAKAVYTELKQGRPVYGWRPIAEVLGFDANGSGMQSCQATDWDAFDGASVYDATGCEAATRFSFTLRYIHGSP